MRNNGIFWKYSFNAIIDKHKPSDVIFAVVREIKDESGVTYKLVAWKIELLPSGLKHPFYGIIQYEDLDYYDLFTEGEGLVFPRTYIDIADPDFEKTKFTKPID